MAETDRLPPGQYLTRDWPVLHHGSVPRVDLSRWTFRVFGRVEQEQAWNWEQFMALPAATSFCDIHCVTQWSRNDNTFAGIPFRAVYDRIRPLPGASHVMVHCEQGFTTNVPLADLLAEGVLFAHKHDGKELSPEHGWPLRLVVPHLYFWKSAKWVRGLEFMDRDQPGFWERNGYHMRGDPWAEERFSDD